MAKFNVVDMNGQHVSDIEITDFVERHADGLAAAFERERAAI